MPCPVCGCHKVSLGEQSYEDYKKYDEKNERMTISGSHNNGIGMGTTRIGMGTTTQQCHSVLDNVNGLVVSVENLWNTASDQPLMSNESFTLTQQFGLFFKNKENNIVSLVVCAECGLMYNAFANTKEHEKIKTQIDKIKEKKEKTKMNKFKFIKKDRKSQL